MPQQEIYDRLKKDHDTIRKLMKDMCETTPRALTKRRDLFNKLQTELVAHEKAEEQAFYKVLEQREEARMKAFEGFTEHHAANAVLRELAKTEPDDERWDARLQVLRELIEHHIEEEEQEMFEKARSVLSSEDAQEIAQRFEKEQEPRLQKH
jgi:hemerythrin-like domain-containing protein